MPDRSSNPVVHVVDDQDAARDLVKKFLATVDIECVGWDSPEGFLGAAPQQQVDLLVIDVRLRGMSGLELVRQLGQRGVDAPVVFISGITEVPVAVEAMKLGAWDFLTKPFSGQALIDVVQAGLARKRGDLGRAAVVDDARARIAKLSPRERQVFLAVVNGNANKVIAIDLGLSEKTVEEHRKHVMTKLRASSVADLVKLAVLSGELDPATGLDDR